MLLMLIISQTLLLKKISNKSNNYISKCFDIAFKIFKTKKLNKFINGPIAKKTFLKKNI